MSVFLMNSERDALVWMEPSLGPGRPRGPVDRQIAVLMSGGVDSSVTAELLRRDGWEVLGVTMKIPTCSTQRRGCCGADAALVCHELGLCHYFVDVTAVFRRSIIEPFRRAYDEGRTPNPCIDCNTVLKFTLVWRAIEQTFGIRHLATGHYARVEGVPGAPRLRRGLDRGKDQSYFLYGVPRQRLAWLHLPLGGHEKAFTRRLAAEIGLAVAEKPESMELCFAGEEDYRTALSEEQRNRPGPLTDMEGRPLGTHRGVANYTLGQRRGLGVAGGRPLYVGRIDPARNTVALGTREQLLHETVTAEAVNVLVPEVLEPGRVLRGKIRSYGEPSGCRVVAWRQGRLTVRFDQPVFAPCPGQRLVLYDEDDSVVAGGTIRLD